jgi:hypothetical protein
MRRREDRVLFLICSLLIAWGAFLVLYRSHHMAVGLMGGTCVAIGAYVIGRSWRRTFY